MSWTDIKGAIDEVGKSFEAYKDTNDARLAALAKGDESRAKELEQKLARIEKDVSEASKLKKELEIEMQYQRDKLEELETRAKSPGKTAIEKAQDDYSKAFMSWVRGRGQSQTDEQKMLDISRKMATEGKAITIGSAAGGGHAVPEEISRMIEKLELKFSPVRRLVKVVQAGTSDYKELISINGATSGWVGENTARPETSTPTLREVVPTHGELYAYPQASEWSLDDIFFNVESWLAESVAEQFAIAEATAVLTGDGSNKPTGMLNSAPTAVTDEAASRAAAVYEFVANVDSGFAILPDKLIDLVYKTNSAYRSNANFVMNSVTAGAIRKLREDGANGQYLWQPGLQAGAPDRLLGYPVEIWEQMQSPGAAQHPIAFGDFRRGYVLADRVGLRMTRDNVTNIGHVRFYVRRREGGIVLNNNAIKWLKTTAT
jgi:HK97 family phage major capsid protein